MSWFVKQRMSWIDESVHIFGHIRRVHIMRKFDVSEVQASHDLQQFQQLYPGVITYNASSRRYEATQ